VLTPPHAAADADLQLIFTHIDARHPSKEFSFAVRILGDNTYTGAVTEGHMHMLGLWGARRSPCHTNMSWLA
jgi:Chromosome segregation protein Spc25